MFRKILLSTAAVVALAGSALAADLPSRKAPAYAPAAAPIFTWAGFYVGAQVGYNWIEDRFADPVAPYTGKNKPDGVVGGLHAGYNFQTGMFVYGLEGDIEYSGASKTTANDGGLAPNIVNGKTKLGWQGSLRARAGVAFDRALVYLTGGVAYADFKLGYQFPIPAGVTDSFSKTRPGWTLGGGVEYALTNNWTIRGEYRYSDFGKANGSIVNCCAPAPNHQAHRLTTNTVRLGVSYKFGGPSAVVAKY